MTSHLVTLRFNHSNDNHTDCQSEHRFKGFPISVLQQLLTAHVLLAGTNWLKHYHPCKLKSNHIYLTSRIEERHAQLCIAFRTCHWRRFADLLHPVKKKKNEYHITEHGGARIERSWVQIPLASGCV